MGKTIPSFRIALGMEKEDWKPFRNALDKKDRKEFDEIFDIPKFYISACSNSVQYVRLHPILMSILLYHYKEPIFPVTGIQFPWSFGACRCKTMQHTCYKD